jgi:hypothetical protein
MPHVTAAQLFVGYYLLATQMGGPLVPRPQQPSSKTRPPPLTAAQRTANATKAAATAKQMDEEVHALLQHIDKEVERISERFNKKKDFFYAHLHMTSSTTKQKREKVNAYNAFLHARAMKENQGTLLS